MELLLVRHGQPAWVDAEGRAYNDPGLTRLGRGQALAVAGALATTPVTELWVSSARRSQETAAPIADVLEVEPRVEPELFELRMPAEWDGAPAEQIGQWFRDARGRGRHEWWQGVPGGEDFGAFHARVTTAVDRLLGEHGVQRRAADGNLWDVAADDDRRFLLVAHAGTNSAVLGHLLGLEPEPWEWERFASSHASITVLRTTPIAGSAIWSLTRFNAVGHLPRETG